MSYIFYFKAKRNLLSAIPKIMPAFKNCEPTNLGMIYSHGKHIQARADASSQNKLRVVAEVVLEYQILFLGSAIFLGDPRNEREGGNFSAGWTSAQTNHFWIS